MKIRNSKKKQPTIGLLTDWIEQRYQARVYAGIVDALREKNVNLISFVIGSLREPYGFIAQRNVIADLAGPENLDGLIIMAGALSNYIDQHEFDAFLEHYRTLPITSIALSLPDFPSVLVDNKKGMHDAIVHLIEVHGYRRIAFIRGPVGHQEAEERYRAYTEVLAEYNLPLDPKLIMEGDFFWTSGTRAIHELIDERSLRPSVDFDAVVASNDFMALSVLELLEERQIRVPEEVAVVGFDNIEETTFVIPALTTVQQPFYEQGKLAAETLLSLMAGEDVSKEVTLPTRLILRNSCGCLSQAVKQVQSLEIKPIKQACETVLVAEREQILAEMKQVMDVFSKKLSPEWPERLFDSFVAEITDLSQDLFIPVLDSLLRQSALKELNANFWQDVVSVLYCCTKPILANNVRMLSRAERLWQQARILVGEMSQQIRSRYAFMQERYSEILSEINASLITTFDIPNMMDVIARELPRLNIKTCYIALYEKGNKVPSEWSRLILAYDQNGRRELERDGKRFLSKQLVPEEVLQKDDTYALAVMPLFFQEDQLGFIMFEIERNVPKVYETLRHQISSVLKGASLLLERRRAEQDLAQSNRELEAFTYSVSHDLRAPLRGMDGFSQILLEDYSEKLDVEGKDYLYRIKRASKHMGNLIDDLLKLSRLTRSEMHFKKVNLSRLVESIIDEFKQTDSERQIKWTLAQDICAEGDEALLKVMLRNLIDNAWKFSSRKKNAKIEFGVREENGKTVFYIRDNGIGFNMDHSDKLFEAFQRQNIEFEGTGIGLTTVERIVRRHGGRIWAEGTENSGATFYFTLN